MSADKKERKKERIQEDVTATILVAMETRPSSPTGGVVNTKEGKRPRAIQRLHQAARRGEAE